MQTDTPHFAVRTITPPDATAAKVQLNRSGYA